MTKALTIYSCCCIAMAIFVVFDMIVHVLKQLLFNSILSNIFWINFYKCKIIISKLSSLIKIMSVVKGEQVFSDWILLKTKKHLKILERAHQLLGEGTLWITPGLWCQTFIISTEVSKDIFVPVEKIEPLVFSKYFTSSRVTYKKMMKKRSKSYMSKLMKKQNWNWNLRGRQF